MLAALGVEYGVSLWKFTKIGNMFQTGATGVDCGDSVGRDRPVAGDRSCDRQFEQPLWLWSHTTQKGLANVNAIGAVSAGDRITVLTLTLRACVWTIAIGLET